MHGNKWLPGSSLTGQLTRKTSPKAIFFHKSAVLSHHIGAAIVEIFSPSGVGVCIAETTKINISFLLILNGYCVAEGEGSPLAC